MAKKGVFPVIATIAIVGVVVGVFSQTVLRDASVSTNTMTNNSHAIAEARPIFI